MYGKLSRTPTKATTMRLSLDSTKCAGYGSCATHLASVFELDEWGYAALKNEGEVPAGDEPAAERAIRDCPEQAIGEAPAD